MNLATKIIAALIVFLLLGGGYWLFMNKEWCAKSSALKVKEAVLSVVGLEQYKGEKLSGELCHLTMEREGVTTDYYLDKGAVAKFKNDSLQDVGNGCIVFSIKNTMAENEMCFGEGLRQ